MNKNKLYRTLIFIKEQFLLFFSNIWYYGFSYAFYSIIWWMAFHMHIPYAYKMSKLAINKKTTFWDKRIKRKYNDILEEIANESNQYNDKEPASNTIWFFWAQGEEKMPPLVNACYRQLRHYNDNVVLVSMDNLCKHVNIDETIITKAKSGKIKWANFSDIVRNLLLVQHGGLWLDSTIWVSGRVPFERLSKHLFWTASGTEEYMKLPDKIFFWSSYEWNWSSSILYSRNKNFILFSFVSKMLIAISEREKYWPDYVIQDYLIYYAHKHYPIIRKCAEQNDIPGSKRMLLAQKMNDKFDIEEYDKLTDTDYFFKLSFRTPWRTTTNNDEQTFYGRIMQGCI